MYYSSTFKWQRPEQSQLVYLVKGVYATNKATSSIQVTVEIG